MHRFEAGQQPWNKRQRIKRFGDVIGRTHFKAETQVFVAGTTGHKKDVYKRQSTARGARPAPRVRANFAQLSRERPTELLMLKKQI